MGSEEIQTPPHDPTQLEMSAEFSSIDSHWGGVECDLGSKTWKLPSQYQVPGNDDDQIILFHPKTANVAAK